MRKDVRCSCVRSTTSSTWPTSCGAWGIALLASYLVNNKEERSLVDFLDIEVFAGNTGIDIAPTAEDVAGFNSYIETYKLCLGIEKAAVEFKK